MDRVTFNDIMLLIIAICAVLITIKIY